MKKFILAVVMLFPLLSLDTAQADASLSFSPVQTSFQFDASGNLTFGLVSAGLVTTSTTCRLKMVLASKQGPLNKGKIKNAGTPEGALVLFTASTPSGLPNSTLTATTTGLSSKPKKGTVYGRAALQCGAKKKTFVYSPIVSFDYSLISNATGKATPQVAREWKSKTVAAY